MLIEGEQHGASGYAVTLGEPLHNNVTGDSAYAVVPATMTFKMGGKEVTQSGADTDCGFGHNVSADGTYKKTSDAKPNFDDN